MSVLLECDINRISYPYTFVKCKFLFKSRKALMMQALEQISFAILLTVFLASQAEGKLNKENEKLPIEDLKQNDKTTVSDDQNLSDRLTAPEDREVADFVDQINKKQADIDNLSIDSVSGGIHSSFAGLENSLLMIKKAQMDMELVNIGQQLQTAVKKRDLKKELKALSSKIANNYMV